MPASRCTRQVSLKVQCCFIGFLSVLRLAVRPLVPQHARCLVFFLVAPPWCGAPKHKSGIVLCVLLLPRLRKEGVAECMKYKPCALGNLQPSGRCIPPPPQPQGSCFSGARRPVQERDGLREAVAGHCPARVRASSFSNKPACLVLAGAQSGFPPPRVAEAGPTPAKWKRLQLGSTS